MPTIHQAAHAEFSVENYTLLDVVDLQSAGLLGYLNAGGKMPERVGRCSHCGANLRYAAIMQHENGSVIMIGEDCLNNRFSDSQAMFQSLRDAAAAQREETRRIGKLEKFLRDNSDIRTLMQRDLSGYGDFVNDVLSKLNKYGSLSPAQCSALIRAVLRQDERNAQRAAEAATMVPAPTGRVTFTGTVLSVKAQDPYCYGGVTSYKMLIKANENYKVWVTAPHSLLDSVNESLKGKVLTLTATLTQSERDATFAIGKRPVILTVA